MLTAPSAPDRHSSDERGSYRASVNGESTATLVATAAVLRSSSESRGASGSKALTTARRVLDEPGTRQPPVAPCISSSRTSACRSPPLAKKCTASCVSAMMPYGLGKIPSAGVPRASVRKAEYGSAVGSACEKIMPEPLADQISSSDGSKSESASGAPSGTIGIAHASW